MGRLENKVAIISGGALGIGEADCILFAREGAKVVIADINEAAGRDLEKRIKQEGNEAIFMRLDVSQEADWQRVMADTIAQYGKVNILVNNAGVSLGKDLSLIHIYQARYVYFCAIKTNNGFMLLNVIEICCA